MTKDEAKKQVLEELKTLLTTHLVVSDDMRADEIWQAIIVLQEALDHIASGGKVIKQPAQQCVACENNPSQENDPCAVCGKPMQQEPAQPAPTPGYCKHCKQYTIEEPLPAQQEPSQFGSPKMQALILANLAQPAPPQQEPVLQEIEQKPVVQWHLSKDGLPPVGSEVVGGYFYKDTWFKGEPEVFAWGQCRVIKDDHPDFPDGKRWITFGPSHNQITYWCWPPKKPGDTSPPAQRKPLTDKAITRVIDRMPKKMKGFMVDWDLYIFARAIEAAHGIKGDA